jgi:hypothetical protein
MYVYSVYFDGALYAKTDCETGVQLHEKYSIIGIVEQRVRKGGVEKHLYITFSCVAT